MRKKGIMLKKTLKNQVTSRKKSKPPLHIQKFPAAGLMKMVL